ncbi:hypothetical protein FDENT_12774 [Fusarium denticulatum]|uniref:F-box domain-containing protein n=1 Tax=Fusarium denticulatum TaxID=48507 RepID=A0A8H5WN75_9HYPO|nr:hypothetical protein FDENT_12774 [Fusarium denticulatum]
MDHIPNEILSHIFSYLLTDKEKHRLREDSIRHVLPSKNTIEDDFSSWHKVLENGSIKDAVRRVAIETSPIYDYPDVDHISSWPESWPRDGHWPEFTSAISRICDMTNLDCLDMRFSLFPASGQLPGLPHEPSSTRKKTLEIISETLRARESRPGTSIIRELILKCLEDTPLPKDLTDNLLQNIEKLHIALVYGDDQREKPGFASYLSGTLLPSVSERLVELTIAGHRWGSIPAEFNGKGLSFPCLKRLTLEEYIILRQDQFDWVLEQRSLVDLNLYSCKIATHCLVQQPDFEHFGVNLDGWTKLPNPSTDMGQLNYSSMTHTHLGLLDSGWYTNDLRWSDMFDCIRQNLPNLRNFNFKCSSWENYFEGHPTVLNLGMSGRYYTFDEGSWGVMWYRPVEERPFPMEWDPFQDEDMPGTPVRFYERAQSADAHALQKLMVATRKRGGGK